MSPLYHYGTHDCLNPWCAMNRPTLRGYSLLPLTHHALHPLEPQAVMKKKSIKGKRHMKKGGKTKVGVNSCTMICSLLHLYTQVWASLVIATLAPSHVAYMFPLIPTPFHFISFATYHLKDAPWTCHPL